MTAELAYIIELVFLISLIFGLHYTSDRIGLLPMLFAVMALAVVIAMSAFLNVFVMVLPQVTFGVIGNMFVPIVILSILLLYILDGAIIARTAFASLLFVSFFTMLIIIAFAYFAGVDSATVRISPSLEPINQTSLLRFLQIRVASLSAFGIAILGSVIVYQTICNLSPRIPEFISIIVAFFVALWLDSLVFFLIRDFAVAPLESSFVQDMIAKSTISVFLATPTSLYMRYATHKERKSSYGRPILSIIWGDRQDLIEGIQDLQSRLYINQQIYQYLTENLNEIIYLIDAKTGALIYVSPAFERITGKKVSLLESQVDNLLLILHPDEQMNAPLLDYFKQHNPIKMRFMRVDGSVGWLQNRLQALKDEGDVVYRYLGVAEDITEELDYQEQELQLKLSQERIQVMNDFIRDASHDLKSPLASMMLKIDMLERTSGDRHLQIQEDLRHRVTSLSKMIDDLFTLSMYEGNVSPSHKEIDLGVIAKQITDDLDAMAKGKSLNLQFKQSADDCRILGITEAINRLFQNLIGNAIRYTQEGHVLVSLVTDEQHVILMIEDTGIGIPQEDFEAVFKRFFRSSNAQALTSEGTGLGMAISHAIVEIHKGSIDIESQVGVGTTVTVRFPRIKLQV